MSFQKLYNAQPNTALKCDCEVTAMVFYPFYPWEDLEQVLWSQVTGRFEPPRQKSPRWQKEKRRERGERAVCQAPAEAG